MTTVAVVNFKAIKREIAQHRKLFTTPNNSHVRFRAEFRIDFPIKGDFHVVYKIFRVQRLQTT